MCENYIEKIIKSKFSTMEEYEDFVCEFDSEPFQGKHAASEQRLFPEGKGLWTACRIIHKEDVPSTSLHLPENVAPSFPATILVASLQNKFTGDINKQTTRYEEQLVSKGDLLVVLNAGCVQLPGEDGIVFVNIQNVLASVSVDQVDFWFYEQTRAD